MDFKCLPCSRSFNSQNALQQHKRFSAAHVFDCATCDRHFRSGRALEQHYENSRAHNRIVDWDDCDRSFFSTQEASNQYGLDIKCETRGRVFDDDKALERHLTNSHEHGTTTTPLDDFFRSFPNFDYDPSLPPATSYANLRSHKWWRRGDAALDGAWKRYQAALESELLFWYGAENDLNAWHTLCRAMGIEPLPQTCWQCKKAVRWKYVNIVDLIEWARKCGDINERVRTFQNLRELGQYTRKTGKIFSNTTGRDHENIVLRHLLHRIF